MPARPRCEGSPSRRPRRTGHTFLLFSDEAARPWPSLLFLSPFLAFYTAGLIWVKPDLAAGADLLVRRMLGLIGPVGPLAPAALVVAALVGWHVGRKYPWRFRPALIGAMAIETAILTVPLLGLHRIFQMAAGGLAIPSPAPGPPSFLSATMTSIGAGIYEELLFRLVLVGGLVLLAERVFRLPRPSAVVSAVLVAAALFAGAHTLDDPHSFTWPTFLFRTAAGVYLSALFALRGFGIAAGAHIAFNLVVKFLLAPAA